MNYVKSDFLSENLRLRRTPTTAQEAYNKLVCLCQLEQRRDPNANRLYVKPLSKRRERIVRMYWAFRYAEKTREA